MAKKGQIQRKNERYHSYKGEVGRVADNHLKREFYADKPFEKLTTDITQFNVGGEKVYLSPVMDLYNREILSYSISLSPNMENFFGRLKVEMFYGEKFESVNAFIEELNRYIHYYNHDRISLRLKGMSPVQYRTHSTAI